MASRGAFRAQVVVGADGRRSRVREALGIRAASASLSVTGRPGSTFSFMRTRTTLASSPCPTAVSATSRSG